jgi:FtsZ-binding cell division protein ZapB
MKKTALAIALILIIALSCATWLVYSQVTELQGRTSELQVQNSELQGNNSGLQNQIRELQNQNNEKQGRLKDFTYQLALARHLLVKITAFTWVGGFNPIGGVTISHPVNVTVQNNDVIPVCGLTLTVRLLDKNLGTPIGTEGQSSVDRINAGESQVISGGALTTLNIDGSSSLNNAVCVATLTVGSVVLDEWRYEL